MKLNSTIYVITFYFIQATISNYVVPHSCVHRDKQIIQNTNLLNNEYGPLESEMFNVMKLPA